MNHVRKLKSNSQKRWKIKRWHTISAVYIVLLVISYLVRLVHPIQIQVAVDQKTVTLGQSSSTDPFHRNIKIAYMDTDPNATDKDPVILLLHGSPVAARKTFHNLIPALTQTGRVIAPDLPGFGASTQKIPDYSIAAHGAYVLRFLQHIGIEKVHVVAYSMGGGVALNLAHMSPKHVRSMTLLSAIGVQEFELLGNYHINHALHGIQLASIWLLKNGLPHMGLLDKVPIGLSYARNFFDTDQRPLRAYLTEFEAPLLILHGRRDALIPVTAAQEHFRIVPQSELKLYDDGHLMVFNQTQRVADDIGYFIQRVETARTKSLEAAETNGPKNSPFPCLFLATRSRGNASSVKRIKAYFRDSFKLILYLGRCFFMRVSSRIRASNSVSVIINSAPLICCTSFSVFVSTPFF